jgi:DNA gyrase subunit A
LLALVNGEPRLLSLKRALQIYLDHRVDVITRRTQFELNKARARAHILEGLLIALANLDDVIQTIRKSADADIAKERLISRFGLTEIQAQAILDMQLRRLAALERQKIEDEHRALTQHIEYLEDLLAHPRKILSLIQEDLEEISEKYSDPRRTHISAEASGELRDEDLVADEAVLISITERGYIKRVDAKTYRSQRRGGRGIIGHTTRDEDEVLMLFPARTLDTVLFFSDRGKVYSEKAYQIPDAGRTARGISIVNVLSMDAGETITAAVSTPTFDDANFCTMATRKGRIKRVALSNFAAVRPSGLIAIGLSEGDSLGWVSLTQGDDDILMVTQNGQAVRFSETTVRPMGRPASGVIGIRTRPGDQVVGMDVVELGGDLLVITTGGHGKRTPLDEYPVRGRATMGVLTIDKNALSEIGPIVVARVVQPADDIITLISSHGIVMRTKVDTIAQFGRATRGVRVMNIQEGDTVAALARIAAADLRRVGAAED